MNSKEIGQVFKNSRKNHNWSVKEVVQKLSSYQINISEKTLYGWENGSRQPDADTFIVLCHIYGINSLSFFSKIQPKKSPELTEVNSGDDADKHPLLKIYDDLNADGQERLMEYAEDLADMPKYKKCSDFEEKAIG